MRDRFFGAYAGLGAVAVAACVAAFALAVPSRDEAAYAALTAAPKPLTAFSYGEFEDGLGVATVVGPDEAAGVPAGCRAYQRQNYVLLLCKQA